MLIDSHGVAEVNSLLQFSGWGSCKVAPAGGQGGHSTQTASLNQQHFLNIFNVKTNTQTSQLQESNGRGRAPVPASLSRHLLLSYFLYGYVTF